MLENLMPVRRGPGRPPIPTGPEKAPAIAARLDAAKAELAATEAEYQQAALAHALGEETAGDRLAAVKERRTALAQKISDLDSARTAALAADEAMFAAQRAALKSTQVAAVRREFSRQNTAATEFTAAMEQAASAYKAMLEAGQKALAPLGALGFRDFAICEISEIVAVAGAEVFRLAGAPTDGYARQASGRIASFPGAQCPNGSLINNPTAVTPLADTMTARTERVMRQLTGKAPE